MTGLLVYVEDWYIAVARFEFVVAIKVWSAVFIIAVELYDLLKGNPRGAIFIGDYGVGGGTHTKWPMARAKVTISVQKLSLPPPINFIPMEIV